MKLVCTDAGTTTAVEVSELAAPSFVALSFAAPSFVARLFAATSFSSKTLFSFSSSHSVADGNVSDTAPTPMGENLFASRFPLIPLHLRKDLSFETAD